MSCRRAERGFSASFPLKALGQTCPQVLLRYYVQQPESICNRLRLIAATTVIQLFLFRGTLLNSLSKKKVAAFFKWTVNFGVIEMCKQATDAGSQRSHLC